MCAYCMNIKIIKNNLIENELKMNETCIRMNRNKRLATWKKQTG